MRKGFTLIEILIASTIFAVIMLIVTGTFTWASSYNGKLKEMRDTSLSARKAMDIISRDVRQANGKATLKKGLSRYEMSEIAFIQFTAADSFVSPTINSNPDGYFPSWLKYNSSSGILPTNLQNGIVIIQESKKKIIIYRNIPADNPNSNYDLFRYEGDIQSEIDITTLNPYSTDRTAPNSGWAMLNNPATSLRIEFAGYGAGEDVKTQQPYTQVALRAQSWNYSTLSPAYRAQFDLKTTIETRDYN